MNPSGYWASWLLEYPDVGESSTSGDMHADSWGTTFDCGNDADSKWSFNTKDGDIDQNGHNLYLGFEYLSPIRTGSPTAASMYGKEQKPVFDSVPGTHAGSVFGKEQKPFTDSAPSTPMFSSSFSPRFSETLNSSFSPRYSEAGDDHTLENFSRLDSIGLHVNRSFFTRRNSFARFDSFRSSADHGTGKSIKVEGSPLTMVIPLDGGHSSLQKATAQHMEPIGGALSSVHFIVQYGLVS